MATEEEPQHGYGFLKNNDKKANGAASDAQPPSSPPAIQPDDLRHKADAPIPWLRYFFPKDFDVREGSHEWGPYYHYFDVQLEPLQEDLSVKPPAWTPNAFYRLSFTHQHVSGDVDTAARVPDYRSPLDAIDLTAGNVPLFLEDSHEHMQEIMAFCRSVYTFKARTWKDAMPLVDLLRGCLKYLLEHMQQGQKLAHEYALRDALKRLDDERDRLQAEHAAAMEAAKKAWEEQSEERENNARQDERRAAADDFALQTRALSEEKDRWMQKALANEAHLKKSAETIASLERSNMALEGQLESEQSSLARLVQEQDAKAAAAKAKLTRLQGALGKARQCLVAALKAQTKEEVFAVALEGIQSALPGCNAYVAELKTKATVDSGQEGSDMMYVRSLAEHEPDGPVARGLAALNPDFLQSPLDEGSAKKGDTGFDPEAIKPELVLKYVRASKDQSFMVGQQLPFGEGVSWPTIISKQQTYVEDVANREGTVLFRKTQEQSGSYTAVPLVGRKGEVLGLLGVDQLHEGESVDAPLSPEEASFVKDMGDVLSSALQADQEKLQELVAQAKVIEDAMTTEKDDVGYIDPEPYADGKGGMMMFKSALTLLDSLSNEDFNNFMNVQRPDDASLAVVKAVLAAAGEIAENDWESLKGHFSKTLAARLAAMNPEDAWAEWQQLCSTLRPLFRIEGEVGKLDGLLEDDARSTLVTPERDENGGFNPSAMAHTREEGEMLRKTEVGRAIGRWANAVRKISAAAAFKKQMEERLARANAALMRTFQGDGSNALQELRSYRVPPRITFMVLQAVLALQGTDEADVVNWGRMRMLANYKMVKRLTEIKAKDVPFKLLKAARHHLHSQDIYEDDVKKESTATLALYR